MIKHKRALSLCGAILVVTMLEACASRAVPPTRETTTTTTLACPPGKTLQSDGMCR